MHILLLDQWIETPLERIMRRAKIFVKDGLLHGDWQNVFRHNTVGGNVTLTKNLASGFHWQNIPFAHNDYSEKAQYEVAFVIKDPRCLRWALRQKRKGRIKKLIVGPLMVNEPRESGRIIESPEIDEVIVASPWVREMFVKYAGRDLDIRVWPLGVDTEFWSPGAGAKRKIILYTKNPPQALLRRVREDLSKHDVVELVAGTFSQAHYRATLETARGIVFLSQSETQGLAMFEAWSAGVPTLHWNPGVWEYRGLRFDGASSCPYLSPLTGMSFSDAEAFAPTFAKFLARSQDFRPRDFILNGHTLEASIQNLLMEA